jgi:hypothetical protein
MKSGQELNLPLRADKPPQSLGHFWYDRGSQGMVAGQRLRLAVLDIERPDTEGQPWIIYGVVCGAEAIVKQWFIGDCRRIEYHPDTRLGRDMSWDVSIEPPKGEPYTTIGHVCDFGRRLNNR